MAKREHDALVKQLIDAIETLECLGSAADGPCIHGLLEQLTDAEAEELQFGSMPGALAQLADINLFLSGRETDAEKAACEDEEDDDVPVLEIQVQQKDGNVVTIRPKSEPGFKDLKAALLAAQERTGLADVQRVVMDHGGAVRENGAARPSLKALPVDSYAEVIAAIDALPRTH